VRKKVITIVDYGMGNLRSVQKAVEFVGGVAHISSSPKDISRSSALIVPGVGSFGAAMKNLRRMKLIDPIIKHLQRDKLFLGICLGFELLFESSSEEGKFKGLGVCRGTVQKFPFIASSAMPIPHMGWNKLVVPRPCGLLDKQANGSFYYFVHSYYVASQDRSCCFAHADYGIRFQAAVTRGNCSAFQFHPEKSGDAGLRIIKAFVNRVAKWQSGKVAE
jgi:glutamine amidotransferase